ncbi:MAG: sensor histidine kinase [Pseudonocardia sp.]|nr:sensor histidine kinase [Pseudonocardia sp.]
MTTSTLTRSDGFVTRPAGPLRALVSPATWLGAAHLLLDVVIGFAATFVIGSGLFFSVVLFPFALLGLPVWLLTAWTGALLGRLERARYALVLGVAFDGQPMPPQERNPLRYGGALLRDPGVRRRTLHQLIAFPLGLVTSVIVYTQLSAGVVLLLTPVLGTVFPTNDAFVSGVPLGGPATQSLFAGLGLVLLLLAPAVIRALVRVDVLAARTLLGRVPGTLTERVGELERSRARVVDSAEAERRRIERDLHDGTQQTLVALAMTLGRARSRYRTEPDAIGPLLDDAHQQAKDAVTELRGLIRGLHPPVLSDRGLDAALSALATRCPVPVDLAVNLDRRPPATIEAIGYFVVAEALTNVARHSGATRAAVTVRGADDAVWITISDDGRGGADPESGSGLRGLADRVSGVDGQLRVDSPVGGPTVLTVELPVRR